MFARVFIVGVVLGISSVALAAPLFQCSEKTFPNIKGKNAVRLVKRGAGHALIMESYDKPRRYKVTCTFHPEDAGTFYCAQDSRRGFFSSKTRSLEVGTDNKPTSFDGYVFEAVDYPLGRTKTFATLRFRTSTCKIPPKRPR